MVDPKKLFVWNVSWSIKTDEQFASVFKNLNWKLWAGEELSVVPEWTRIVIDRATWRSKGFGFVVFEEEDDARRAKEELDGVEVDGRPIRVDYAVVKEENR